MLERKKRWIIGYSKDFDFIIIGKNTGPYSEFPSTNEEARTAKGNLHYIHNLVSQIEGEKFYITLGPIISKCPAMDDWNNNVREPMRSFDSEGGVVSYLRKEARPFARTAYLRKHSTKILENFSTEGLVPS